MGSGGNVEEAGMKVRGRCGVFFLKYGTTLSHSCWAMSHHLAGLYCMLVQSHLGSNASLNEMSSFHLLCYLSSNWQQTLFACRGIW